MTSGLKQSGARLQSQIGPNRSSDITEVRSCDPRALREVRPCVTARRHRCRCRSCRRRAGRVPAGIAPAGPCATARRTALGRHAMVASGSPIASEVGRDIMRGRRQRGRRGGRGRVRPGGGPSRGRQHRRRRVHDHPTRDGKAYALDYRETAPGRAPRATCTSTGRQAAPTGASTGALAAGVPGSVAGLVEAHRRFGRLPLAQVIDPAIRLARDGFVRRRATGARRSRATPRQFYQRSPASAAAVPPRTARPRPRATVCTQPELARTLEAIRDHGARRLLPGLGGGADRGRDGARAAASSPRRTWPATRPSGGSRSSSTYRGYTIYSMPPASSGGVTLGA